MKRILVLFLAALFSIINAAEYDIDIVSGSYTGIVFNTYSSEDIIFNVSSDTSSYSLKISLFSVNGKYMVSIFDGERPSNYKITWDGKDSLSSRLKPGMYFAVFEKTGLDGEKKTFIFPLLAAGDLK